MPARVCDDRIISGDATERWCPHCCSWKILTAQHFYRCAAGYNGFQRTCKECRKRSDNRRPHLEVTGWVYLNKIRPWLRQLVTHLGWTKAARRLGVSNSTLARWMKHQKRMQRRYAALVLNTCAEVGIRIPLARPMKEAPRASASWANASF